MHSIFARISAPEPAVTFRGPLSLLALLVQVQILLALLVQNQDENLSAEPAMPLREALLNELNLLLINIEFYSQFMYISAPEPGVIQMSFINYN